MSIRKYVISTATLQSAGSSFFGIITGLPSISVHRASMSSLSTPQSAPNTSNGEANIRTNPIAAVAQLRSTSDKFRNLLDIATCARFAKSEGASMLFLPECFGFMGESSSQTLEEAEDPAHLSAESLKTKSAIGTETESSGNNDRNKNWEEELELTRILKSTIQNGTNDCAGDADDYNNVMTYSNGSPPAVHSLMNGLRTIAKESGLWISGGGIHVSESPADIDNATEQSETALLPLSKNKQDERRVYNTHVILDSSGALIAQYRKIHLFDVSIPGKVELRESKTTAPGTELVACDSPVGRLGITTCYDLRFPEMYTELTQTMGAQVLLVPSAFTIPTGAAHWHVLLRARAIENQCYVLAAAQYGKHNEKRVSFGHSLIVDPWGKVIADAGGCPTTEDTEVNHRRPISSSPPDPPSIVTHEIDLTMIDSIRQRMPIDMHRSTAKF